MKSLGIGIIGCGKVGTALGTTLSHRGRRIVGTSDIVETRAQTLANSIACGFFEDARKLADRCDILFLTVTDSALIPLCESLGEEDFRARFLIHTSGILPSKILHLAGLDRAVFSIHPFGGIIASVKNPFENLFFGCEGDKSARELALEFVTELDGRPVELDWQKKTAYHLAASLTANHGFAILEICSKLLQQCDICPAQAIEMTASIAGRAISNFQTLGFKNGLTGPIVRGDGLTIAQHIAAAAQTGNLELYLTGLDRIKKLLAEKDEI